MKLIQGDCREVLRGMAAGSVRCCVTSPPYFGLRDYGVAGQIGLEPTPEEYVARLVEVFREVRRVLADDGTLWLNLGDSYAANRPYQVPSTKGGPKHGAAQGASGAMHVPPGLKPKDLIGIPWRVAFALQADGWYLRQDIIWHKPNPMPESVRDRCTKAHEYLFLLSKRERYFFDSDALREPTVSKGKTWAERQEMGFKGNSKHPTKDAIEAGLHIPSFAPNPNGKNRRSVWTVTTQPFRGAHFATFPPALVEPCVRAGSAPGDTVLDPFNGAGTTGLVALREGRHYVGVELNPDYLRISAERLAKVAGIADLL